MDEDDFRRIALSMEGAVEGSHMGHPDFRVNGRIFATLHHDRDFGMVSLSPEDQEHFVSMRPETFSPEAGAWGRRGSTRVHLPSVEEAALRETVALAWRRIAGKKQKG